MEGIIDRRNVNTFFFVSLFFFLLLDQLTLDANIGDYPGSDIWAAVVDIPSQRVINYRYLICAIDPATQTVHVRQWETHITPRNIPANTDTLESFDTFGDIGGLHKVDRGWLTNETIFQFSFYNNPFMLTGKAKNKLIYVKVSAKESYRSRLYTINNLR